MTLCYPVESGPAGRILLGWKKRGFGEGKLVGFGGKLEPGESPDESARRELREEIGITVSNGALRDVGHVIFRFPAAPELDIEMYVFMVTAWQGTPAESDEMRPQWFSQAAIPFDRMWDDARYWLPEVLGGQRIEAAFTFDDDNQTVIDAHIEENNSND